MLSTPSRHTKLRIGVNTWLDDRGKFLLTFHDFHFTKTRQEYAKFWALPSICICICRSVFLYWNTKLQTDEFRVTAIPSQYWLVDMLSENDINLISVHMEYAENWWDLNIFVDRFVYKKINDTRQNIRFRFSFTSSLLLNRF